MKDYLERSMSFAEYEALIEGLLAKGMTTGPNPSPKMVEYTTLNRQRMHRLKKTVEIGEDVKAAAKALARPPIWLIITEAWCGDAAQNIPVIEKIAAESPIIETRYILRDENLELMDRFLTGGGRSIPKLIALDAGTLEVLGTWGSRPAMAQQLFAARKAEGVEKVALSEELQRWYNTDHGKSLQQEFVDLIQLWGTLPSTKTVGTVSNAILF